MNTNDNRVAALLDDIRSLNPTLHELMQAVRQSVREVAPGASESVMYGGIMFAADAAFCGVFSYSGHVSVEFGKGRELDDPLKLLEGSGKFRRHLKLHALADLQDKQLRGYLAQACANANAAKAAAA